MLPIIIETIPQLVFWKDKNSVFLGCNKKFSDSLGLNDPKDIIGKTDFDVTDEENAKIFIATDLEVVSKNEPIHQYRQPYKNAKGDQLWFNINKVPLHNENGEIIGVLGTMEDITEQINLETKLRNNNIKYKSLIESTNTAYIILNEELDIMETNEVFLKLIKSDSLYSFLGKPLSLWIAPKYSETFEKSFKALLKGQAINDLELYLVTDANDLVCVSLHANIIENGNTRIFCLVRNINNRKIIESEKYISEQKKKDRLKQNIFAFRSQLDKD